MFLQALRARGKTNTELFDEIYSTRRWGVSDETSDGVSSGQGSRYENIKGYVDLVVGIVQETRSRSILDVGCGDYRVGRMIMERLGPAVSYVGVDASKAIIERNTKLAGAANVRFIQIDAVNAELPQADLILIREVLQHLCLADVSSILRQVPKYRENIITNTEALSAKKHNMDMPSGSNSRAAFGGGLWFDIEPFNYKVRELARWPHADLPTEIVSVSLVA